MRLRTPALFGAALLADLLSKEAALRMLPPPSLKIGDELFAFALHFNPGVAFSLFRSIPGASLLLGAAGLLLLIAVRRQLPELRGSAAWPLLFAGAAGNLADRLLHGHVIDWLRVGPLHMNAADLFLSLGGMLFVAALWRER